MFSNMMLWIALFHILHEEDEEIAEELRLSKIPIPAIIFALPSNMAPPGGRESGSPNLIEEELSTLTQGTGNDNDDDTSASMQMEDWKILMEAREDLKVWMEEVRKEKEEVRKEMEEAREFQKALTTIFRAAVTAFTAWVNGDVEMLKTVQLRFQQDREEAKEDMKVLMAAVNDLMTRAQSMAPPPRAAVPARPTKKRKLGRRSIKNDLSKQY